MNIRKDLVGAFDAGAATFALWMAASESTMKVNWRRTDGDVPAGRSERS